MAKAASAERHNDIEKEYQNALVNKALEEVFDSYLETKNERESRNDKNTKASTVIENNDDLKETQSKEKEEEGQQQREEMKADIDKLITKKNSIKIPWKKGTPKIIKKGEIHKIWYSQQSTKKQLKRLESLKAQQQQRSKTSQLKRVHVMLNNCKSLCIWNMLLSWIDQDVCNMFSCFDEISRCQITDPTRKVVRLQKRAYYFKKKDSFFFTRQLQQ
ncbi:hypothetical protein RFI_22329 [Reticulomyxa filosa]|uniref:Uncharacterized protein n=1 Tax=Reticulomyxa filosa TaxID=46433 RepID=X6MPM0_RETFI|nr:hypothetical protein RFI_22329 [Reticulomyxa filosa]|eukprot:ETO15035.1 hypothetical protein RFI_22329 [Reticulomyxa filosa]